MVWVIKGAVVMSARSRFHELYYLIVKDFADVCSTWSPYASSRPQWKTLEEFRPGIRLIDPCNQATQPAIEKCSAVELTNTSPSNRACCSCGAQGAHFPPSIVSARPTDLFALAQRKVSASNDSMYVERAVCPCLLVPSRQVRASGPDESIFPPLHLIIRQ